MSSIRFRRFGRALLAAWAILVAPPLAAAEWRVAPGFLADTLSRAAPGDEVLLLPGEHPPLILTGGGGAAGAPITLRPADARSGAVLTGLTLNRTRHLELSDLDFRHVHAPRAPVEARSFLLKDTVGISFVGNRFEGDVIDARGNVDLPAGTGLHLDGDRLTRIDGNSFVRFARGITAIGSEALTVTGNTLRLMRTSGITGTAVTGARLAGNEIRDFRPETETGALPTMIGFSAASGPVRSVEIADNLLTTGDGPATHGILIANEPVGQRAAGREGFHGDVAIEGNVVINAHPDGILVGATRGLTVRRNTVVRTPHAAGAVIGETHDTPRIEIAGLSRDVVVLGNVAPGLPERGWREDWIVANNLRIQDRQPSEPGYVHHVFNAVDPHRPPGLSDYVARSGGPLDPAGGGSGRGAPMLAEIAPPEVPGALDLPVPAVATALPAMWLDPVQGRLMSRLHAGDEDRVLAWTGPDIRIGPLAEPLQLTPDQTAPLYSADRLEIDLSLAPADPDASGRAIAGEVMRIHEALVLTVSDRGVPRLSLRTQEAGWVHVAGRAAPVFTEEGATLAIRYDGDSGAIELRDAEGTLLADGMSRGPTRLREHWGLSFGNPFDGAESFDGHIRALEIRILRRDRRRADIRP